MVYDLIIIGMGPGGVAASIYAKRSGLNILTFDGAMIGGYLNYIDRIDNYPGLYGISGPDFAFKLFEHVNKLEIPFKNEKVLEVLDGEVKKIVTNKGEYLCNNVIIATGRREQSLGLANEDQLLGKGVSHCALCDGAFYKDREVCLVGNNNSALQEALYLSNIVSKLYLVCKTDRFKGDEDLIKKVESSSNIVKLMNKNVVELISSNDKLSGVKLDDGSTLDVSGLFVYNGFKPSTKAFANLNITNDRGFITVNSKCETSVSGIYAIGDIIVKDVYQVVTAVSEGAIAVTDIIKKNRK